MSAPRVEPRDGYLRVHFTGADPESADFHYFWLRHGCDCCRHPVTGERTLCSSRVSLGVAPESVALSRDQTRLQIVWREETGRHASEYRLDWLREHAYAPDRHEVPPPCGDSSLLEVACGAPGRADLARVSLERVERFGAAVVRDAGADTEALIDAFAHAGLKVIATHFGRIEDLRTDNTTNPNTDQLGYTDAPVDLHTDQPFLDEPPRYQMLHCMRPADVGGDNYVADAHQAAFHLKSLDSHAFELLTRVPVRFHRVQKKFERLVVSPVIELRGDQVFRVRSSYFTMAPHVVPFEEMESWYRAYNRFAAIMNDPAHQCRFRLEAGDFLLYDNFRMLHARTGFSGTRFLRGVYFDPSS